MAARMTLGGTDLSVVGRTRIYVCGVTPYDVTHLGHAATYVWVDAVDRVLRRLGSQVEVCRNVTDVDDVLFAAAERAGGHYEQFAAVQQFHFEQDMDALGVRKPAYEPRAHVFIPQVIALAQSLLDRGVAYAAQGSVYLPAAPVIERAGLERDTAERLLKEYGGRLDDPAKRDPLDQAVWQVSGEGEPAWANPFGTPGRPGWHAECTAMALSTYGPSMDLHAGGADLRFPHHAFESAQAEAATGVVPFARAWMHVGIVQLEGQKMAKSVGNLVFAKDLIARSSAGAVRTMLLDRRYDEPWDYTPSLLDAAGTKNDELYRAAGTNGSSDAAWERVLGALADDLDVRTALDIAIEEGGQVARDLTTVLAL